jgi:hypothetical protein
MVGDALDASAAAPGSRSFPCDGPPFGPSCWHGVGHPVATRRVASTNVNPKAASSLVPFFGPVRRAALSAFCAVVVGHPE